MRHSIPPPVYPGQSLEVTASFWNLLREMAADYVRDRDLRETKQFAKRVWPGNLSDVNDVMVRNVSDDDCPAFGLVRITGVAGDHPLLDGGIPGAGESDDWLFRRVYEIDNDWTGLKAADGFGIAMNLIEAGEIGRVRINGYAPVVTQIDHQDDQTVGILPSETTFKPTTGRPGPRMVAAPPAGHAGTDQLAIVDLGGSWLQPMRFVNTSGSAITAGGGFGDVTLYYYQRSGGALASWQIVEAYNHTANDLDNAAKGYASVDAGGVWQLMTEDCAAP